MHTYVLEIKIKINTFKGQKKPKMWRLNFCSNKITKKNYKFQFVLKIFLKYYLIF